MRLSYDTVSAIAHGTEYIIEENNKIIFSRFLNSERQTLTYGTDKSYSTAGVRLEFITDSQSLDVSVSVKESNPEGRNFYSFDVYNNDVMLGQIKNFDESPQYPYKNYTLCDSRKTFRLSDKTNHVCIYFPWSVQGIINGIEIDDGAAITPVVRSKKVIMYGDSITQGYDSESPSRSYTSQLADYLEADVINKGIGGSVFMPELSEIKSDYSPNLITVAYGTNDWNICGYDDFEKRCHSFFNNLITNYPDTKILAIAPIWRADCDEERNLGKFSKVAETLKNISVLNKNISFINGIDFIPKDKKYYRDSYLHPNDMGFDFYIYSLINELKKKGII